MVTPLYILIVDASIFQRVSLRLAVQRCFPNAHVTTVATGYDDYVTYHIDAVDMLILDHYVPEAWGNALVQYLREAGIPTPIILVSSTRPPLAARRDAPTGVAQTPVVIPEAVAPVRRFVTATGEPQLTT